MFKSAIVAFTLAAVAQAISVEMPAKDTVWQSGGGAQTVSWEAVSTDATSFAIQLINQVRVVVALCVVHAGVTSSCDSI